MDIRGWVYVISNEAMPGLVKVGYSTKDPTLRALELAGTGIPHPFFVVFDILVLSPRDIEQGVHRKLGAMKEGKEWFRCDASVAIAAIREEANRLNAVILDVCATEDASNAVPDCSPQKTMTELTSAVKCPACGYFSSFVDFQNSTRGPRCIECGQRLIPLDLRIRRQSV